MSTLEFTHEAAYKVLLRFRSRSDVPEAFVTLSKATVFITDVARHQVLLGTITDVTLISRVYNFSHSPYDELFNGLCALCSSATPVITKHLMTSDDDKIFPGFDDSNLGIFGTYTQQRLPNGLWELKAKISYPS